VKRNPEPIVTFDYGALDPREPVGFDAEFWTAQGEFLGDVLRWLTIPRSLSGIGARCCTLVLYLNPGLINKSALREISAMPGAPGAAALSKAMIEFQDRYGLHLGNYQKPGWARERYSRSAIVAHQQSRAH
jgi:hypothetical protein